MLLFTDVTIIFESEMTLGRRTGANPLCSHISKVQGINRREAKRALANV